MALRLTTHFGSTLDKEAADKLSKTVDEACLLLAEYNGRLAAELEDRRQLARMLTEYISSQKEALMEREKKLEVRHSTDATVIRKGCLNACVCLINKGSCNTCNTLV